MKMNKNYFFMALLIGILLVVISIPTKDVSLSGTSEAATDVEKRLEAVLSGMDGVGDVSVMVTFRGNDEVEGVVVIAEGGENPVVVRNISEVVQALFDVESHKIKVIKGN